MVEDESDKVSRCHLQCTYCTMPNTGFNRNWVRNTVVLIKISITKRKCSETKIGSEAAYLKIRPKWNIMRLLHCFKHLKQSIHSNQYRRGEKKLMSQICKSTMYKITRMVLSGDKTTCCHSVIAVSGGHMGLLHKERKVNSLTKPSYSSVACHFPICRKRSR